MTRRGEDPWLVDTAGVEVAGESDRPKRIRRVPGVCGGRPVFYGTRIWPEIVCTNVAAGMSSGEVVEHWPSLTHADVAAALRWCRVRRPAWAARRWAATALGRLAGWFDRDAAAEAVDG